MLATATLVLSTGVVLAATPASAIVPSGLSPVAQPGAGHVTADSLPTAQIGTGVVWSQLISGNTVYVGGDFGVARPPGAPAGTGEVTRSNFLAYNLTTGQLTNFSPSFNNKVYAIAKSPDGSRIYVGGAFSSVDGKSRGRIAAFDTATGGLIGSFTPSFSYNVKSIVATNDTVYVGGLFGQVNGNTRQYLAAFRASNGALLDWAPAADGGVQSIALTPDGSKLVVGGSFTKVNGVIVHGMTAVDATTGAVEPWAANQIIHNDGDTAAILSVKTDGTYMYAVGYTFGPGTLEGTVAMQPDTGNIVWVEDCHGDTYDNYPSSNGIIYTVSHAHFCSDVGGFPQSPNWETNMRHTLSFTREATGTVGRNPYGGYYNFEGMPSPSMYNWFPDFAVGTFTGKTQAAWTVTGNDQYVIMGGEFPRVNGVGQQGLARFAIKPIAPAKMRPTFSNANWVATATSFGAGTARVAWPANIDPDDLNLTYKVVRDGDTANPVYTSTAQSTFWNRPTLGYIDRGLTPGSTHSYRVYASDGDGNVAPSDSVSVTIADTGTISPYAYHVLDAQPANYWRLGEPNGPVVYDWAGTNDAIAQPGVTRGASGAIAGDSNDASSFNGASSGYVSAQTQQTGGDKFSIATWFKTSTNRGGKIVGFGSSTTGNSSSYDRQVYMDNNGRIWFGVYPGSTQTVNTTATYSDNQWHEVVATLGPNGMRLYVDGQLQAQRDDVTAGQSYDGYWRIGGDNLAGWPGRGSSDYFAGTIDDVAIYQGVLAADQVLSDYNLGSTGTPPPNQVPVAKFSSSVASLKASFDASQSSDPDGSVASYAWDFGDGSAAGSGVKPDHTYVAAGSYVVKLTVTDNDGGAGTVQQNVVVTAPVNQVPVAKFSSSVASLKASFDASQSSDPDGSVASYAWDFGDGSAVGSGVKPDHTYVAAGSYVVKLTVTDNDGGAGTVQQNVVVTAAVNQVPVAKFSSSVASLKASFDASQSSDPDGSVASYAWDFGDGSAAGSGVKPDHTYVAAGSYVVKLTVTDNDGGAGTVQQNVVVTAAVNQVPVAKFSSSVASLKASFDASQSSDPDGSVASYAWDFGDGSAAGSGVKPDHTYVAAGSYVVKLTVTDNDGGAGTVQQNVVVTAPPVPGAPFAKDAFGRTVGAGLGSADTGGPWSVSWPASAFSVSGGQGRFAWSKGGSGLSAYLNSVASVDTDLSVDVSLSKPAAGAVTYTSAVVRHVGSTEYGGKVAWRVNGDVALYLTRVVNGSETILKGMVVPALTVGTGDTLTVRMQAIGTSPTALNAKVWKSGTAEPSGWQLSATDTTTALQAAGSVGVVSYVGGPATNMPLVVSIDNLTATDPANTPPPNQVPVAKFSSSVASLKASFDASQSSDPDGSVASYAWDFGDGSAAGSGVKPDHTYVAAGSYVVKLTVTDNDGGAGTVQQNVVVTAPPVPGAPFAKDAFGRTVGAGLGSADTGGPWSVSWPASAFSVSGGQGRFAWSKGGSGLSAYLNSVASVDTDLSVDVSLSKPAAGAVTYTSAVVRHVGSTEYGGKVAWRVNGDVALYLTRVVNGSETILKGMVVPALTVGTGDTLTVRMQAIGTSPTALNAKVWKSGTAEPSGWQLSATDTTTALQAAGSVGVVSYVGGPATNMPLVVSIDNLTATDPTATP